MLRSQPVQLRLPDTSITAQINDIVEIPVYADSSLTGRGVYSYELQINYNGSRLMAISAISTGTISSVFGSPTYNVSAGQITIAGAGVSPLSGSGLFLKIRFQLLTHGYAPLNFNGSANNFFNEGNPPMATDDGSANFPTPPSLNISPSSAMLVVGEQAQFTAATGTPPYTWWVTDSTVATIDTNGLLTATAIGTTKVAAQDANAVTGQTNGDVEVRGLRVTLPDTSGLPGDTIDVPVWVSDVSALNISSGHLDISYNQSRITPLQVVTGGAMIQNYPAPQMNIIGPGAVRIAFAGSAAALCALRLVGYQQRLFCAQFCQCVV